MRVSAKPPRSTKQVEVNVGSAASSPEDADPPAKTSGPTLVRLAIVAACLIVVAATALLLALARDDTVDPGPVPRPSDTPTASATPTPTATATPSQGVPSPTASPTTPTSESDDVSSRVAVLALAAAVAVAVVAGLVLAIRRRAPSRGTLRRPRGEPQGRTPADQPRASLGSPDVLVLTEAASEGDVRLRERVRDREQAIFANLQLACNFYPTERWVFSKARLTVTLAREDGRAAPAPIAYALRPLSDRDGSAREQSVEIGADMKFVSVKGGDKSTAPGEEFVRGYGVQESVSYWEFTATQHQPLQGSFLLWLIARAPTASDLKVTSTLEVWVAPRSAWSRADEPAVGGTGEVSLLLRLKDGPPYRAQLGGATSEAGANPWLVDVR